jgi:hypothetical protein
VEGATGMPRRAAGKRKNRLSQRALVKLAVVKRGLIGVKALETLTDIAAAELGEFVTAHAFFVKRQPPRNGTLCPRRQPANLQLAKNGRNK